VTLAITASLLKSFTTSTDRDVRSIKKIALLLLDKYAGAE